jgi:hypothetical protein
MPIAILAVLTRSIVVPTTGEPAYITQETEVVRFNDSINAFEAFGIAERLYPLALSYEIYRPRTDADSVQRV